MRPTRGLAVRPEKPSEPPHLSPTTRSASVQGVAPRLPRRLGQLGDEGEARLDLVGLALRAQRADTAAQFRGDLREQQVELVRFAAEADQQHAAGIGMAGERGEDRAGAGEVLAELGAAEGMGESWTPSTAPAWRGPARAAIARAVRATQPTVGRIQISLRVPTRPSARR